MPRYWNGFKAWPRRILQSSARLLHLVFDGRILAETGRIRLDGRTTGPRLKNRKHPAMERVMEPLHSGFVPRITESALLVLDYGKLWLSERGVTVDDLAQWLERLGLAQYTRLFAENDIDLDVLPHLTDDELRELGVTLGHRAKLRAALGGQSEAHPSAKPATPRARETGDAERRQVSVMFCDLVASTALSTELDAED